MIMIGERYCCLIIHENIKAPSFKKDFDIMFEAGELNELLSPYGEMRCFVSNACSAIAVDKVEDALEGKDGEGFGAQ